MSCVLSTELDHSLLTRVLHSLERPLDLRREKIAAVLRGRSRDLEDKNDQGQTLRETYLDVFVGSSC